MPPGAPPPSASSISPKPREADPRAAGGRASQRHRQYPGQARRGAGGRPDRRREISRSPQLQFKAAAAANDEAAMGTAIEAMLASGGVEPAKAAPLHFKLGKIDYKNKQYAQAAASFERALAINPANTEALIFLGRDAQFARPGQRCRRAARSGRSRPSSRAGQQAQESNGTSGQSRSLMRPSCRARSSSSRQWVAAYPTPANWRDALRIYRSYGKLDDALSLDILRLARATGALAGDAEFQSFAALASQGLAGRGQSGNRGGDRGQADRSEQAAFQRDRRDP